MLFLFVPNSCSSILSFSNNFATTVLKVHRSSRRKSIIPNPHYSFKHDHMITSDLWYVKNDVDNFLLTIFKRNCVAPTSLSHPCWELEGMVGVDGTASTESLTENNGIQGRLNLEPWTESFTHLGQFVCLWTVKKELLTLLSLY